MVLSGPAVCVERLRARPFGAFSAFAYGNKMPTTE